MPLKVKLLSKDATPPSVAYDGDVAFDLYCSEDIIIPPNSLGLVRTHVAIEFTNPRAGAVIKCRSGLARQGLSVEGGVIDAGYRGEVGVMIRNNNAIAHAQFLVGDRVAQMLKQPVLNSSDKVHVVAELSASKRGEKGFGSSGR